MNGEPGFRGVYAIPITPFNEDLSVDWKSLGKCIEFSVDAGAHGIVIPVNASEGPLLSDTEREMSIQTAVNVVNGTIPIVAGVSGSSIVHSVNLTNKFKDMGVSSVIAMPPNGANTEIMEETYSKIAEIGQIPVWIQNNKPPAGPTIATKTIVNLLKSVAHVDYVKEESLLPGQVMTQIFNEAGNTVKGIMGGMGGRFLCDEYRRGACGTMPAGHITDAHVTLWKALEAGGRDENGLQIVTEEARGIWEQMIPALNFEFLYSVFAYKMAYFKRGIIKTPLCRTPANKSLDNFDVSELNLILDRLGDLLTK